MSATVNTRTIDWQAIAGTVYGGTLTVNDDGSGTLTVTLKGFSYSSVSYYGTYGNDNANLYYMSIPDYSIEPIRNMQNASYTGTLISNMLKKTTTYDTASMKDNEIRTKANSQPDLFYFRADSFADLTELNAFLADNPMQVVAELATPVVYTLTPADVGQILTQIGRNNIWADTGPVTLRIVK